MMTKEYRIKKNSEIDAVFALKRATGNQFFVIYQKSNDEQHFRVALSIGKKFGNSVERNRGKRRVRNIVNEFKKTLKAVDFIIVFKANAKTLNFQEIRSSILELFKKGKLLVNINEKN